MLELNQPQVFIKNSFDTTVTYNTIIWGFSVTWSQVLWLIIKLYMPYLAIIIGTKVCDVYILSSCKLYIKLYNLS